MKNIARFHHHLNPVGIGRVVLSLCMSLRFLFGVARCVFLVSSVIRAP